MYRNWNPSFICFKKEQSLFFPVILYHFRLNPNLISNVEEIVVFSIVFVARNRHFYRETTIENNQRNDGYLIQSNLDKAFKCTVVNLTCHSVKRGFFKLHRQFLYSDKRQKTETK